MNLGSMDLNQAQNEVFRHFLSLDDTFSLKAHTSLRQWLAGKTHKKNLVPNLGQTSQNQIRN